VALRRIFESTADFRKGDVRIRGRYPILVLLSYLVTIYFSSNGTNALYYCGISTPISVPNGSNSNSHGHFVHLPRHEKSQITEFRIEMLSPVRAFGISVSLPPTPLISIRMYVCANMYMYEYVICIYIHMYGCM